MSDPQNTPWYPPGEGWVEWHGGENPVSGAVVQVLLQYERAEQDASDSPAPSDEWDWDHKEDAECRIVAYRVVTPAPSTVDRALFDEMVEALAAVMDNMPVAAEWANGVSTVQYSDQEWDELRAASDLARAVLAKAREAGK